jgi:hypothetical protein
MPPELTGVLAALAVEGNPGEFAVVESLLGGSFSGLGKIRRNPVARIDAAGLAGQGVRDWLCGLPLGQDSKVQVAWIADRLGARMSFGTFASNVSDAQVGLREPPGSGAAVHGGSNPQARDPHRDREPRVGAPAGARRVGADAAYQRLKRAGG